MLVKCLKQSFQLQLFGFFMSVLHAFYRHWNIILLRFYLLLLLTSVLRFRALLSRFCENQFFEFYRNSTDWLPHYAGSECGESRNRLQTVLYPFSSFFVYLYFTFIELLRGYFLSTCLANFLDKIY